MMGEKMKDLAAEERIAVCPSCGKDRWPLSAFTANGTIISCDCGISFMPYPGDVAKFYGNLVVTKRRRSGVLTRSKP